jgi:(2R)-3-sulfolactate dehydrogenase (NADP+)
MVEVLAAALVGANLSSEASSFFDGDGDPPGVGQLMIVIEPGAFGGPTVAEKIGHLIDMIDADDGTRVPGSTKRVRRAAAATEGIRVDLSVVNGLRAVAGLAD